MEYLELEPGVGGRQVVIRDFDTTAVVLVTSDLSLVEQLKADVNRVRPMAVDLAIRKAEHQLQWVTDGHNRLVLRGRDFEASDQLLSAAREFLEGARAFQSRGEYARAYEEAGRVGQSLRLLMHKHHAEAVEALRDAVDFGDDYATMLTPTSCPPWSPSTPCRSTTPGSSG